MRSTDSKNGSDSYPHQSDSLVHAMDTPCIERDIKNPINRQTGFDVYFQKKVPVNRIYIHVTIRHA